MTAMLWLIVATLMSMPAMADEGTGISPEQGPSDIGQFRYYSYPDISAGQSAALTELLEAQPTAAGPGHETVPKESMEYYSYPAVGTERIASGSQQPAWTPSRERTTPGK